MAWRIDTQPIAGGNIQTASVGIRVPAFIARTGILEYIDSAGNTIREYRPPSEVMSEESLQSWMGAPVTVGHPTSMVDELSYSQHSRGHIGDDVKQHDDKHHVFAHLYIFDDNAIKGVISGKLKDLSGGYFADIDETPGIIDGHKYDRVQRNIRGNHVALLSPGAGRSGDSVSVRLDSSGNAYIESKEGDRMDIDKNELQARYDSQVIEINKLKESEQNLRKRCDAQAAEIVELKKALDETNADLTRARDPLAIDALVAKRNELISKAKSINPEMKFDGLTEREIMSAALGNMPKDATDDYIRGAFEARCEISATAVARSDAQVVKKATVQPQKTTLDSIEEKRMAMSRDAWKIRRVS